MPGKAGSTRRHLSSIYFPSFDRSAFLGHRALPHTKRPVLYAGNQVHNKNVFHIGIYCLTSLGAELFPVSTESIHLY
jgi:hypothetical protein